nr:GAF domain-containing protein [Planctomycetota bacterium]
AYLGLALRDDHGRPLGTLSLWSDAPPQGSARASLDAILAVVAERAAAELLRLRAQTALTSSLRLERGLTGCARALLADVQPPRTLDLALRHLVETTNASAISLFENEEDDAGDRCLRRIASAAIGEATLPGPEVMPYRSGLRRWENDLSSGLAVGGLVRHLPGDEQGLLAGVRTVLALPVIVRGEWVGFLRIDDCRTDYRWLKEEVRLLRSGADLVGAFLERRSPLQGLRRQGLPASIER